MDCFGHTLVVEVVDIEVNNSVGVVDKGLRDIVAVRIDLIGRLVDHMLVDAEVDKIDSVGHHLMTPYMMDSYCNLIIQNNIILVLIFLTYCNLHSVSAFDHFDQVVYILDSVGNPLRIEDSEALPLNETRSMTFLR